MSLPPFLPIIFSDRNVPFFKSRICQFSEPHSFSFRKLLLSINIRFHSHRSVKIKLIDSVYFHRVCPKIQAFRPLTSRLIPFFSSLGARN